MKERPKKQFFSDLLVLVSHVFTEVAGGTWMEDGLAGSRRLTKEPLRSYLE